MKRNTHCGLAGWGLGWARLGWAGVWAGWGRACGLGSTHHARLRHSQPAAGEPCALLPSAAVIVPEARFRLTAGADSLSCYQARARRRPCPAACPLACACVPSWRPRRLPLPPPTHPSQHPLPHPLTPPTHPSPPPPHHSSTPAPPATSSAQPAACVPSTDRAATRTATRVRVGAVVGAACRCWSGGCQARPPRRLARPSPPSFPLPPAVTVHCITSPTVASVRVRQIRGSDWEAAVAASGIAALTKG